MVEKAQRAYLILWSEAYLNITAASELYLFIQGIRPSCLNYRYLMNIVLSNDESFFSGLWCTVLSMLTVTPDASSLKIHVLDTGIKDSSWKRLADAVAKHPMPPVLERIPFPMEMLKEHHLPDTHSPLVYTTLFLPEILTCDRVLYLDSDLLIFRNVLELEKVDLDGYAYAAVVNEVDGTLEYDLSREESDKLNLDPQSSYFNAGFMLMNLKYWRVNNVSQLCFDFLAWSQARYGDQTAMNSVLNGKIKPLDREWNRFSICLTPYELIGPSCIIHYVSKAKPWLVKSNDPTMLLWVKFLKGTGLAMPDLRPAPAEKVSVWERCLILNLLRLSSYALLAIWYALLRKTKTSEGYLNAFSHWVQYCGNRKYEGRKYKKACRSALEISHVPNWLGE